MTESIFKGFYKKIASNVYTGSDLKTVLINANSYLASNKRDINSKKELLESSIYLAKNDIGLYIRIMNLCVENSLYCFNYIFLLSSVYLIDKTYAGKIPFQDQNYQKMFDNIILIIIYHEILEEIDILDTSETIIIGKDPRIQVSFQRLPQYKHKIFELFNKKYTLKLLDTKYDLESNELINTIRKLNFVYTDFGKHIPFSPDRFCYSERNMKKNFESYLSKTDYDKKMYEFGFLLFPLISEIDVTNDKIIVTNEGFGNLVDCDFSIIYQDRLLYKTKVDVDCLTVKSIYIEKTLQKELSYLPLNDDLEFRFNFEKFERRYVFSFKKKIGLINEELNKRGGWNMVIKDSFNNNSNSFNNNSGIFAPNSKGITQNLVNNIDIEKLRESYSEFARLIDESDMEKTTKEEAEKNIKEIQDELSKDNGNLSKIVTLTGNLVKLASPFGKLLPYAIELKNYLLDHLPN